MRPENVSLSRIKLRVEEETSSKSYWALTAKSQATTAVLFEVVPWSASQGT